MKYLITLALAAALQGCSIISIYHEEGRLPEVNIRSGIDGCKIKPKANVSFDEKEVTLKCKWKFQS